MKTVFSLFILLIVSCSVYSQNYSSFEKWMPKPTSPYVLKNTAYCESYHGENTWVVYQIDSVVGSSIKGRQQWVMRMDMNGNNLWSRKLVCNNSYVNSITPTPDDGVILTGHTPNGSYWIGWLCKIDKEGIIQWSHKYNSSASQNFYYKKALFYSNYIYILAHKIYSTYSLPVIVKTDTLGNVIWCKEYQAYTATHYPGFIGCIKEKLITFSTSVSDNGSAYLCDIDTSGKVVWNRMYKLKYSTLDALIPIDVSKITDNTFLVSAGHTYLSAFILDSLGTVLWNNYIPSQQYNVNFLPLIQENNKIYSFAAPLQTIFHRDSVKNATGTVFLNLNIGSYPNSNVYYSNNIFNHKHKNKSNIISVVANPLYTGSNIWLKKIDTTIFFDESCSKIVKYVKDTTLLVKDSAITVSNYTTSLSASSLISMVYPLNLQWTFECGKLAPSSIISQHKPTFNLVLYPNPAQEAITIRTDLKNYDIRVWDSYGKLLHSSYNIQQSDYTLPIEYLPQGTYHIECISNNQHYVQTFVKIQ